MSKLTQLFERILKHNRHDEVVEHLFYAACSECGHRIWGFTEPDVWRQLSHHGTYYHDVPPSEYPQYEERD